MTGIKILKNKKIIACILSAAFVALLVPAMQPALAGVIVIPMEIPVTPDRQNTLVEETQTYSIQFVLGGDFPFPPSLSVTCDPPAVVTHPPTIVSTIPAEITVTSDTPGIFICKAVITGTHRPTGDPSLDDFILFGNFVPVFTAPPVMCGPGTILNEDNKCVPDLTQVCGPGTVPNEDNTQCVIPNTPPDCSQAVANPNTLWPPNHKMKDVSIAAVTDPDGDLVTLSVTSITQDEPTNGLGDGDVSPDGSGIGTNSPQVRSERSGLGDGRVYVISFDADDGNGGVCQGSVSVTVPHDSKDTATDSGQSYDSTLP